MRFGSSWLLGALVPRVSYMTRLDVFILGATMVVFLALVETLIAHARSQGHDRAHGVSSLDRCTRARPSQLELESGGWVGRVHGCRLPGRSDTC